MNAVISQMLEKYQVGNLYDRKNAMKEILQEIALCGLSRAGFFRDVAFYGGTALRIFYGLDRFSEDLDFSLEAPDISFDISKYFPILEKEVNSFGINVSISEKKKQDVEPFVQDTAALNIWCEDFFKQITEALKAD